MSATNKILFVQGKDVRSGEQSVSNSFWVYEICRSRWSVIYRNENGDTDYWQRRQSLEPRPRYAHQLVYEEEAGLHFMFGGNPGGKENRNGKLRLGDFWRLELQRQQNKDLERVLVMEIRKTQFREKSSDPVAALAFLQTEVSSCVDHEDREEQREFQAMASQVFSQVRRHHGVSVEISTSFAIFQSDDRSNFKMRSDLFDKLMKYFPSDMAQPQGNLNDLH